MISRARASISIAKINQSENVISMFPDQHKILYNEVLYNVSKLSDKLILSQISILAKNQIASVSFYVIIEGYISEEKGYLPFPRESARTIILTQLII